MEAPDAAQHSGSESRAPVLVAGATGYVGGRLLPELLAAGHDVRCVVRRPETADLPSGAQLVRGDVLSGEGLDEAMAGADVAYYLVHSMGGANGDGDFAERDRRAARTFGGAVARVTLGSLMLWAIPTSAIKRMAQ